MINIDDKEKLVQFIEGSLKPDEEGKKKFGEVFTPIYLINKILDKLPIEIWKKKDYKWLDPGCGIANFTIIIYYRLMESLKNDIKNTEKRKKHILENMLHFTEMQEKNINILKEIFQSNKYNLNIFQGNFIECKKFIQFPNKTINNFDIIIGNPPFNDDSGNKGKSHTLWPKFVSNALSMLKIDGYLSFIHPCSWRKMNSEIGMEMRNRQIVYLEMSDIADGRKVFRCNTDFDWYIIKNCEYNHPTKILDYDKIESEINLKNWKFIPNKLFNEINQLINHDKQRLDVNYYRSSYGADKDWISTEKKKPYLFPVIYSIGKEGNLKLRYSSTNQNGHFGRTKFIFTNGAGFYCDNDGKYGLTQWAYCIYDNVENLGLIENCFRSEAFRMVVEAIKLDSSAYNIDVMKLFPKDFYLSFQ